MVVYFHKNHYIASNRQTHKYFREALPHELAQELLDAKENPLNENADAPASCQSKVLFRLKGRHFLVSKCPKRGRWQNVAMRKINQRNIRIRKQ